MVNLIKSETYKLINSKTYKMQVIFILLMIISLIIGSFTYENGVGFKLIYAILGDRAYGFHFNTYLDVNNIKGIEVFKSSLGIAPVLVVILSYLVSFLTCDEYKKGTYKNILSYGQKRECVYIAKLISISIGIAIMIFLASFGSLIIGTIIYGWGVNFEFNQIISMVKLLLINTIIFISIASIFMIIGTIFKNSELTVLISILFLFSPIVLLGLPTITLDIIKYHPIFMLMDTCIQIPGQKLIYQIIFTCIIIIVVFTIVGSYIFKRQDIK